MKSPKFLRPFLRRPGTPLFAVTTLALGMATAVSVVTVVDGVLVEDLPYPDPERLVLIWRGTAAEPAVRGALSPGDWLDLRERSTAFSDVAAVNSFNTTLTRDDGTPDQVEMGVVTGNFFATLGLRTSLGRGLGPDDDRIRSGADDVGALVLDHGYWERGFGADPGVLGRTVRLGGNLYTVVGVTAPESRLYMPRGSGMATDVQGWIPFDVPYANQPRDGAYLRVVARLAPGVGVDRADAELDGVARQLRGEHVEHAESGLRLRAVPLADDVVAHVQPVLTVLGLAAFLVLLVACANVAVLLMVRFMSRRGESAIRMALGAERSHVLRLFLVESTLVCLVGTALGVALAAPAIRGLLALQPGLVPRAEAVAMDAGVLPVAVLLAGMSTLLCGLVPAAFATVDKVADLLRSRDGRPRGLVRWLRPGLVVAQVGASFVLLYGGSALLRSLLRVEAADPGFEESAALTARLTLPLGEQRGTDEWVAFFGDVEARLSTLPDVEGVGLTSDLPTEGEQSLEPWAPVDVVDSETWGSRTALTRIVSPGYFRAVGQGVRAGRAFTASDGQADAPVAVVDQALADALGRDGAPVLGRQIATTQHTFDDGYRVERAVVEVVGVVGTVPHEHPAAPPPGTLYRPLAQYPLWAMSLVARGASGAVPAAERVTAAVADVNPGLPVTEIRSLEAVVASTMATTRFLLALVSGLAVVVMALTAAGLFGLIAETVLQRRKELGVRIALGAHAGRVVGTVLSAALAVVSVGLVPGALLTPWAGARLRAALGYGRALDVGAVLIAALVIVAVSGLACYLPARRAGRIQPTVVLRGD